MRKSNRRNASKQQKVVDFIGEMPNSRVDFIGEMPDSVLESILERLPTSKEIVRTSVLSKRWRYLWTSFPSIDLDISRAASFDRKIFTESVTRALEISTLDLNSFRLSCAHYYGMLTVRWWISVAVSRKVKVLDLEFGPWKVKVTELPKFLITCDSLESLRLFSAGSMFYLSDVRFLALKVLELKFVKLKDEDSVQAFFENCPLLEELNLVDCLLQRLVTLRISGESLRILKLDNRNLGCIEDPPKDSDLPIEGLCNTLEVCCPKLVYFLYGGHIAYNFYFENMDSLKEAVVHPEYMVDLEFDDMGDAICDLFAGFCNVEELSINLSFLQAMEAAKEADFPTSLLNLKTLEISTSIDDITMKSVMRILKCSPNLESLSLIILKDLWWWSTCWNFDVVLTHHLKRVEFLEFNGEEWKLSMARRILKHANGLKEMVFSWREKVKYDEKSMDTLNQVSTFHKASPTVEVFTLLKK